MNTLRFFQILGDSLLVERLRPGALWLRDNGYTKQAHLIWDHRSTTGQYWELFGCRIGPVVWPFSAPRRNKIEEWTTPRVLALWQKLGW